jgi:hypothetical protein
MIIKIRLVLSFIGTAEVLIRWKRRQAPRGSWHWPAATLRIYNSANPKKSQTQRLRQRL